MIAWQQREWGQAMWHDLPHPDQWVEVMWVRVTGAWWAMLMSRGSAVSRSTLGPFDTAKDAQGAAEREWIAAKEG
jgi:hypothetical protein